MNEHWKNKKVAFLGDSITDKIHVGTTRNYWDYLAESCQIVPLVYGLNGWTWAGVRELIPTDSGVADKNLCNIVFFLGWQHISAIFFLHNTKFM